MTEQLNQILSGLEAPALAVIASEAELALRIQQAIRSASESATANEKGNDRESR